MWPAMGEGVHEMSTLLIKPIKKTGHKGLGWSKMLKNGPHGLCMVPYLIEPTKAGP